MTKEDLGTTASTADGNRLAGDHTLSSAVGKCCRVSARMLEIADNNDLNPGRRIKCQAANAGQAALLREAANIADEHLAALNAAAGYLTNAIIDLETGAPKRTAINTLNGGLKIIRDAMCRDQ